MNEVTTAGLTRQTAYADTRFQGRGNRAITTCPFCGCDLDFASCTIEAAHEKRMGLIKGFSEKDGNVFTVYECPECFETLYHHAYKAIVVAYSEWRHRFTEILADIKRHTEETL